MSQLTMKFPLLVILGCGLVSTAQAAACGCTRQQQGVSMMNLLESNSSTNQTDAHVSTTVAASSTAAAGLTEATPTAAAAKSGEFSRIDDMFIPVEDLQSMQLAQSNHFERAKASSSSSSRAFPPRSYVSCRGLWPNGRLYYRFSSSISSSYRNLVRQSLAKLTARIAAASNGKQLVAFLEYDYFIRFNYVNVIDGIGCYSYIGRVKTLLGQELSLSVPGCMTERIVQHEFMHALGFYHEQSRPDRDGFVNVLWSNIDSETCSNFLRHNYKLPTDYPGYDYSSVMHYSSNSFACTSGLSTIVMLNGSSIRVNSLSSQDVAKLAYTYSSANLAYCSSTRVPALDYITMATAVYALFLATSQY